MCGVSWQGGFKIFGYGFETTGLSSKDIPAATSPGSWPTKLVAEAAYVPVIANNIQVPR